MRNREWHLVRQPAGLPTLQDFELAETTLPAPSDGEVAVRNIFLSVDPYMRGRMTSRKSYSAPYEIGKPLEGGAIGRVEVSKHAAFKAGDLVSSYQGWREGFVTSGAALTKIDAALAPPQAFLGVLGMPGLTAYVGLLDIAKLSDGESVLVSGAAGAVGSVVCQIAKGKGCRVVGVVGSEDKAKWLLDHHCIDAAINYRTTPNLRLAIQTALPGGVDVTFENVGGPHLEAALACAKDFGRVAVCGLISGYNATEITPGPRNFADLLVKRLTMRGFIVSDHWNRMPDFLRDMAGWIRAGKMAWTETIVEGIENTPSAFVGLFEGKNLGKMVVKLS